MSGDFAFISGLVSRDGVRGELDPIDRFTGTADPNVPEPGGEYCLRFADGAGTTLGEHCFPLNFRSIETQEKLDEQYFSKLVPLPIGTAGISLRRLGAELDSITASASAPQVEIQGLAGGDRWEGAPEQFVRWTGSDTDGDPLEYTVFYSPDGSASWRVMATGLTATQFSFDPSQIQGGPGVRFRVVATDGFHKGGATVGPVEVVQQPQITVDNAPVDLGEAVLGQSITGSVTVSNPGSGPLAVTAVASDSEQFEVLTAAFPMSVSAGSSRGVLVRYTASAEGAEAATLTIGSNAAGQPSLAVAIQGTGTDGQTPRIRVARESIGFFGVATGVTQTSAYTVENVSLVDLEVEWEFAGADVLSAQADGTAFTIAGGGRGFIEVTFAPQAAGEFPGTLTIRSNDPDRAEIVVPISGNAFVAPPRPPSPVFSATSIVSAADFSGDRFAAEMWVALFGENLADELLIATGGLPTSLGGTSIAVTDSQGTRRAAKLQFVSPGRANFLIPAGTSAGPASVEVTNADGETATAMIGVEAVAPGLFSANSSGQGPAAATWLRVAGDGTRTEGFTFTTGGGERANVPLELRPETDQLYISFFGTGFRFQSSVSARIGGVNVPVAAAVAQGQFDGLDQAVVGPLPPELAGRGEVDVEFIFNGVTANTVTVNIQ